MASRTFPKRINPERKNPERNNPEIFFRERPFPLTQQHSLSQKSPKNPEKKSSGFYVRDYYVRGKVRGAHVIKLFLDQPGKKGHRLTL